MPTRMQTSTQTQRSLCEWRMSTNLNPAILQTILTTFFSLNASPTWSDSLEIIGFNQHCYRALAMPVLDNGIRRCRTKIKSSSARIANNGKIYLNVISESDSHAPVCSHKGRSFLFYRIVQYWRTITPS